ncbi:MFS transporter [Amycolatopsis sp. NPDC005232]|uniref:MFS transporter n=1 Tax=Amycolatopsis sp. NPDC005232 TaxID=3157027 RepID=UPI0033B798DE
MLHTVSPVTARTVRPRLTHDWGFRVIALAFAASLAFSTVPTPLYAIYQRQDGFPTFVVTLVFVAYAVGVMTSLYLAGHVSDWLGRRRVIVAATLAEALAAALFLSSQEVPVLLLARLISGAGIGALTATATAHLSELRAVARPGEHAGRAALIASVVNLGGLGLGPLVGGFFAKYATSPLTTPFAVFLVVLLAAAVAVALVPETVEPWDEPPAYRPQRLSLPADTKPTFFGAAIAVFASFAITGLFAALAPTLLAQGLHQSGRLLAGIAAASLLVAAALGQIVFARLTLARQLRLGFTLMAVGLVVLPVAALLPSLWLFFAGSLLAGTGMGLGFRASVTTVATLAGPRSRGQVLAALFLAAYAGLVVPVLAVGLALVWVSSPMALLGFSVAELLLLAWSANRILRPATRPFRAAS